jgi:hypothetical protein
LPIVVGFGFPIENPKSHAIRERAVFVDDIRQESLRVRGVVDRHPHFAVHHGFAITADHVLHVGQALGVQGRIVRGGRVKGHSDDIPIGARGFQPVKHPFKQGVVIAVGKMNNHFRVWKNRFHGGVAAVDQLGKRGEVIDAVDGHLAAGVSRVHRP